MTIVKTLALPVQQVGPLNPLYKFTLLYDATVYLVLLPLPIAFVPKVDMLLFTVYHPFSTVDLLIATVDLVVTILSPQVYVLMALFGSLTLKEQR